jgi:hypothetical protein
MFGGSFPLPFPEKSLLGRSQAVRQRILIPPFGGSIPPAPATQSLDLRLLSIFAREARKYRVFSQIVPVSDTLNIDNFNENLRKVSDPNRGNSHFWVDNWRRLVRSPLRGRGGSEFQSLPAGFQAAAAVTMQCGVGGNLAPFLETDGECCLSRLTLAASDVCCRESSRHRNRPILGPLLSRQP